MSVSNADDPAVQGIMATVPGRHFRFSTGRQAEGWFDRAGGWLMLGTDRLLLRARLPLLGDHNIANALAAGADHPRAGRVAGGDGLGAD